MLVKNSKGIAYKLEIKSLRPHILKNSIVRCDTCAICKTSLNKKCPECILIVGNPEESHYDYCGVEEVLEKYFPPFDPLELLSKEGEKKNYFDKLPKDLLFFIVQRIPQKGDLFLRCPIIVGNCNHVYHNHCINNWRTKRDVCPLDGRMWSPNKMDSHVKFKLTHIFV